VAIAQAVVDQGKQAAGDRDGGDVAAARMVISARVATNQPAL
jgi:hypothetical protein